MLNLLWFRKQFPLRSRIADLTSFYGSTIKSLAVRYLRKASDLRIQGQMLPRGISAFLSRYSMSRLDILDLIDWFS
ncbi:hypothetical protein L873DRAFT_1820835 [Choiromyces venosus 120613-1]|uniref:Uncharacterized protein n=1 Tax=Choiromyces venosus 120613-1 TaxID=1336337 RepID=A0A3N4IWN7_9PEZI|nr:hypothetical protein L873DRAFT_1820835 [Choiromyces venosus 120613-1]